MFWWWKRTNSLCVYISHTKLHFLTFSWGFHVGSSAQEEKVCFPYGTEKMGRQTVMIVIPHLYS